MKTIIVPTDFSAPAENAMLYAGQLAMDIHASVLLLHVYQIPVGMNDMPVLMVSADELKNNAEAGLNRAKELLKESFATLEVQTESRLGDVADELKDLCEKINPFAIVVGKHGASGIERILFGSTSLSIIRRTNYPVIVIPDNFHFGQLKNTALAIDSFGDSVPVQKIKTLVAELKTKLHIIHVKQEKSGSPDVNKIVSELHSTCKTIYDHEFVRGVDSFIRDNNIDLLIILPHKHNLMERLFFRTHTSELLQKLTIPIMCISET